MSVLQQKHFVVVVIRHGGVSQAGTFEPCLCGLMVYVHVSEHSKDLKKLPLSVLSPAQQPPQSDMRSPLGLDC